MINSKSKQHFHHIQQRYDQKIFWRFRSQNRDRYTKGQQYPGCKLLKTALLKCIYSESSSNCIPPDDDGVPESNSQQPRHVQYVHMNRDKYQTVFIASGIIVIGGTCEISCTAREY